MDPKSAGIGSLGGAIIGVAALALGEFIAKENPTHADIAALYAASQAELAAINQAVADQDPAILAALPNHDGRLKECTPDVAEFGTDGERDYRVSYYRCRWVLENGSTDDQWLNDEEEARAREALKDDSKRPELVRVAAPVAPPVDPHPRDLSIPVYQVGL